MDNRMARCATEFRNELFDACGVGCRGGGVGVSSDSGAGTGAGGSADVGAGFGGGGSEWRIGLDEGGIRLCPEVLMLWAEDVDARLENEGNVEIELCVEECVDALLDILSPRPCGYTVSRTADALAGMAGTGPAGGVKR